MLLSKMCGVLILTVAVTSDTAISVHLLDDKDHISGGTS